MPWIRGVEGLGCSTAAGLVVSSVLPVSGRTRVRVSGDAGFGGRDGGGHVGAGQWSAGGLLGSGPFDLRRRKGG